MAATQIDVKTIKKLKIGNESFNIPAGVEDEAQLRQLIADVDSSYASGDFKSLGEGVFEVTVRTGTNG